MNIIIVEDNFIERNRCVDLLKQIMPTLSILQASTGEDVYDILDVTHIDAALIDIELPDTDGFTIATKIRSFEKYYTIPILFITGYGEDSIELHDTYHHYIYLKKPYTSERFIEVTTKLLNGLKAAETQILNSSEPKKRTRVVLIYNDYKHHIVNYGDILYAETSKHYTILHTKNEIFSNIAMDLHEFGKYVNESSFLRCHRSFFVNINNVASIEQVSKKTWDIYFTGSKNSKCSLSFRYKKEIVEEFIKRNQRQ